MIKPVYALNVMSSDDNKSGLSFILCCYNSEDVIKESISALNNQQNENIPFEVILVDNNCTDETIPCAKANWTRTDAELKIVSEKKPGLIYARKKGVKNARFNYISFVDDDNFVEPQWVVKVCKIFEEKNDVGALGSHNNPIVDDPAPTWFYEVQMNYACGKQMSTSGYIQGERKHLWGAGLSIRKEIIDEIFSPKYELLMTGRVGKIISSGDDSEICFICRLMGWMLWYEDDLYLSHRIARTRLNWKYHCKLVEGFGAASSILTIYKRRIDNLPPQSYLNFFFKIFKKLIKKLWQNKFIPINPEEGNHLHKKIYHLWGMLKGLFSLRNTYKAVVRSIYYRNY